MKVESSRSTPSVECARYYLQVTVRIVAKGTIPNGLGQVGCIASRRYKACLSFTSIVQGITDLNFLQRTHDCSLIL